MRQCSYLAEAAYPYALLFPKLLHIPRHRLGNDHGNICARCPHIRFQLFNPVCRKMLCSLAFVYNFPAFLAKLVAHHLDAVSAFSAFTHFSHMVKGKAVAKQVLY